MPIEVTNTAHFNVSVQDAAAGEASTVAASHAAAVGVSPRPAAPTATATAHNAATTGGGQSYVLPGTVGHLTPQGSMSTQSDASGVITRGPGTYDGVYFQDGLYLSGAGTYVFTDCIFEGTADSWLCVAYDANLGTGSSLLFEDCTFRWRDGDDPADSQTGNGSIVNLGISLTLTLRRCDLSGMAIGVQAAGTVTIEDCVIHDLVYWGTFPDNTHGEAIACYQGTLSVTGSYLGMHAVSGMSTACLFFQGADINAVTVSGCYIDGGGYQYYAQGGDHAVTNNVFGPNYLFGRHSFAEGSPTVVSWTGNVDHLGNPVTGP